jgi:hypothetical protein
MIERVIYALLYLCGIVLCYYLIIWVLAALGLHIPGMVLNILLVMLVLIAILILVRLFVPGNFPWWPKDQA